MLKKIILLLLLSLPVAFVSAQTAAKAVDISQVVQNAKVKIERVNDYVATGRMRTNVTFLKVPVANISVYFKKPNRVKVKSEKGISFIPKGAVSIDMGSILAGDDYTIIDAGTEKVGNTSVRVARLLPNDDNSNVVLSTVYIDPVNAVILKARTTTRENGTFELEMTYVNFIAFGLPDKIIFTFNTKDYRLPKGVTFDFDDGTAPKNPPTGMKNKKGKAEITFSSYIINKGVTDDVFK
jgi:outer membrane lipoprotein-sorting protein